MKYIVHSNHSRSPTMMHPAVGQQTFTEGDADQHMDCPMDRARMSFRTPVLTSVTRLKNSN